MICYNLALQRLSFANMICYLFLIWRSAKKHLFVDVLSALVLSSMPRTTSTKTTDDATKHDTYLWLPARPRTPLTLKPGGIEHQK